MKVLIAGWFSFEDMGATAGDVICRDLVVDWLTSAGIACESAVTPPFTGGIDWNDVDAETYSHVVFVCGPFGNGWPVSDFLEKFRVCELIGLNLTMLDRLDNWNPFDLLLERDSDCSVRPDMTFLAEPNRVPVVGVILADRQKEYGQRAKHDVANAAIDRLLSSREAAVVNIDTRLDPNRTGLRTAAEIESLISRMDLVVTTRLHGTVLALKSGVPALAIDPIAGGHKVRRQVSCLEWPVCLEAERLTDSELVEAFEFCLTNAARQQARECSQRARQTLSRMQQDVLQQFQQTRQEV